MLMTFENPMPGWSISKILDWQELSPYLNTARQPPSEQPLILLNRNGF
jgi:hypothetical protein